MEEQITLEAGRYHSGSRLKIKYFLGFLVWPFGVMMAALRHRNRKWSVNIFWLFCIFLGLTFVIASEGPDSARYASTLKEFHDEGITWFEMRNTIYTPGSNVVDVMQPVLTWLISLFTDNPSILMAGFALIFGFFYSRNIWYLLSKIGYNMSIVTFVFVLTFVLINPIWHINGFRMYSASQVFIFGLLPFLVEGDKKRLWWSAVSILFHFSFVFPVAILVTYLLFKNRLNIYFIFFIVTSFINTVNLEAVRELLDFVPDFLNPRIALYTDINYAQRLNEAYERVNWYVPLSGQVLTYTTYLFTIFIFFKDRKRLEGPFLNLFCFGIWFYGWANLASLVPLGGRFVSMANLIMIFFITIYLKENYTQKVLKFLKVISMPGLLLFIVVTIRVGFDFISFTTVFGNPFLSIFIHDNTPLITYVKELF